MLSLGGVMKVSEGSIIVLFVDSDVRVLEYHHEQPSDVEENSMTLQIGT
jgi:hypothetical protein